MKQAAFLKTNACGEVFVGTKSDQQSFCNRLKLSDNSNIKCGIILNQRKLELIDIEDRLVQYIELRAECRYREDKCGVAWITLHNKAVYYVYELGHSPIEFKVSS